MYGKTVKIDKAFKLEIGMTILYWICTFFTDTKAFAFGLSAWGGGYKRLLVYFLCKIILFVIIFLVIHAIVEIVYRKNEYMTTIFLFSMPYFIILMTVFLYRNTFDYYVDELNMYNKTIQYYIYPYHFTYIQGIFWIESLMLIPIKMGPAVVKIVIQSLICGYIINRINRCGYGKWSFLLYSLFCLPPVITYSYQVHRMQIYGIIYLLTVAKMFMDHFEKKECNYIDVIIVSFLLSILTYWRREGIYLLLFGSLFIITIYTYINKKMLFKSVICFYIIQAIIATPHIYGEIVNHTLEVSAEKKNTYLSYYMTMCRYGLDKTMYEVEIESVNKVWNVDILDLANMECGDNLFAGIPWNDYDIDRDNVSQEEYKLCFQSIQSIILNEPILFLKTRIQAWRYAAIKGIDLYNIDNSSIFNLIIAVCANLWIPILGIIGSLIYSMVKRKKLAFEIMAGVLVHTIITICFMPIAYFKYFYEMYLVGYLVILFFVISFLNEYSEARKLFELKK